MHVCVLVLPGQSSQSKKNTSSLEFVTAVAVSQAFNKLHLLHCMHFFTNFTLIFIVVHLDIDAIDALCSSKCRIYTMRCLLGYNVCCHISKVEITW